MTTSFVRLLKDPVLARRLARRARHPVEAKYTWERLVALLEGVYRRAVEDKETG